MISDAGLCLLIPDLFSTFFQFFPLNYDLAFEIVYTDRPIQEAIFSDSETEKSALH